MTRSHRNLKPSQIIRRAGKVVELPADSAEAARRFAQDYLLATAKDWQDPAAIARIRRAIVTLTDHENLIVTLLAGNGANLQEAARRAHRGITQVRAAYQAACDKLAAHYGKDARPFPPQPMAGRKPAPQPTELA